MKGLAFIRKQPVLLRILGCTTTLNFFVMAIGAIEVTFMVRELAATPFRIGLVYSLRAIDGLTFGAVATCLTKLIGTARVIWVAMTVPGPFYLLMPLAQPGWGVLLFGAGLAAVSANLVLYNVAATSYPTARDPSSRAGACHRLVHVDLPGSHCSGWPVRRGAGVLGWGCAWHFFCAYWGCGAPLCSCSSSPFDGCAICLTAPSARSPAKGNKQRMSMLIHRT